MQGIGFKNVAEEMNDDDHVEVDGQDVKDVGNVVGTDNVEDDGNVVGPDNVEDNGNVVGVDNVEDNVVADDNVEDNMVGDVNVKYSGEMSVDEDYVASELVMRIVILHLVENLKRILTRPRFYPLTYVNVIVATRNMLMSDMKNQKILMIYTHLLRLRMMKR